MIRAIFLKKTEYPTSSPSMLNLTMVVSDITIINKPVKFQFTITNGTKKFVTRLNNIRHFYINGGSTVTFNCSDLAEYFNPNNINFNGYDYSHIGNIPEGNNLLKICLIDVTSGKQISNFATIPLYAAIVKAPELRAPKNDELYETEQVTNTINFKWFQQSIVTSPFKYRFELFEIPNNNISLYTIAESTKPIFTQELTSVIKEYSFNVNNVNMKIGQKYAWRVVAFDETNILTFANNGKSEIFTFQYKSPAPPITGFTCKVVNNEFRFQWDANQEHTSYEFTFKESSANEFRPSGEIPENKYTLKSAKDDYGITARVRAICHNDKNRLTEWVECSGYIPIRPERKIECGKVFPDREITNFELKTEFEKGEIVESKNGDSRFEIQNIASNNNGVLSGTFFMIMECWHNAKILCEFTDTKINTDNIILETEFANVPVEGGVIDVDAWQEKIANGWLLTNSALTSTVIRDTIIIDQKFDYMYQDENGKLKGVVIKSNGDTEEFDVVTPKSPEQCLVTDGKGDSLVITSKGQPMGITEYRATGGNKAMLNDYHRKLDSTANFQLNFLPSDKQKYAFDYLGSGDHGIFATNEYYPKSGSYDFRYKSIETGKTDYIKVDFSNYNGLKDSVIFKDRFGIKLKLNKDNSLTFTATQKPDTNYIYAYDKEGVKIGKLMLKTYTPKIYNIVLVSVNGEKLPYTNKLKDYLNQIYNQSVTKFEINTTTLEIKDLLPFKHGDKKRLSGYNEDQKRVLQAFDSQAKDDINYLFFMPDGVETNGVAGYNPFGYNFGFIYHGAGMRTIAHELGHGIGSLTHPFDDQTRDQANTANLMDSNDKEELYHFQWNAIQNPPKRIFKWNFEEEDAEAYGNNSHYICLSETYVNKLKESGYRYYYLPDGKVADYKDYRPSGFYTKEDGTSKTSYGAVATIKDGLFNKFIKNYEPSKGSFKDLFVNFMYHENGIRISNSNDIVKSSSIIDDIADNCKNYQEIYNLFSALLNLDDATKFIEYLSQIKINELTKIINIVLKYPDLANIISKLSDIKNIKYLFSMISNIDNPEKLINRLSLYSEKTKSLKTDELISCYYQIYQKKPSQIVNINGKQTEIKILDFISDGKYYFEKKESELLGKHFQTVEYIVKDKQDQKGIAVASESGNCCYYIFSENQTGLTIINMVDGISSNIIRSDGVRKFLLDNISDFYNFLQDKGFEIIY